MKIKLFVGAALLVIASAGTPVAYAALTANSTLTQSITAGVLSTDVRNASGAVVGSPSFALAARTVSTSQQSTTGTFGDNAQRITVDNPGGANGGWTLTLNAATPGTGVWSNGTDTYAYNSTAANGQLTVNPVAGTITALSGTTSNISKGTSATFTGTTAVTLLDAAAASDDILNVYVTGIGLTQTIPANIPAGNYTISMVQTVATK
ncbi:MAG TPA: hypothetical protein PKD68_02125 [Candidatus Saccharibacteria bacterium]|nr:hypothetical protein [Candidatus Saccharibacteria bacterium]